MPDDTTSLNFQATLNADEVKSGASEAVSALEDVGEAGRGMSAKTVEQTANLLDSLVKVRDAVQALQGLLSGGDFAMTDLLGGVEVLASKLGPEGELAAGVIAITSSLLELTSTQDGSAAAAQRQAEAEREAAAEISESASGMMKDVEAAYTAYGQGAPSAMDNVADSFKIVTDQIEAQVRATKDLQSAQDELKGAQLAAQIAKFDQQEEEDERGKTPEQAETIKREYQHKRLDARQKFDSDKAHDDAVSVEGDLSKAQVALQNKQKALDDSEAVYKNAMIDLDKANQSIVRTEVQPDVKWAKSQIAELQAKVNAGTSTKEEQKQIDDFTDQLPLLQTKEDQHGKSYDLQLSYLVKQLKADEKIVRDNPESEDSDFLSNTSSNRLHAQADERDTKAKIDAIGYYNGAIEAANAAEAKNSELQLTGQNEITELKAKVAALETKVQAAQIRENTLNAAIIPTEQAKLNDADDNTRQKKLPAAVPMSYGTSQLPPSTPPVASDQLSPLTQAGVPGAQISPSRQIAPTSPPANEAPPLLQPLVETNTVGAQAMQAAAQAHAQLVSSLQSFTDDGQKLAELMTDLARATDKATKALGHRISVTEAAIASLKNSHH